MTRKWLFLEGNLSPQDIYNIYRQNFFETGFFVAQAGFQHTTQLRLALDSNPPEWRDYRYMPYTWLLETFLVIMTETCYWHLLGRGHPIATIL